MQRWPISDHSSSTSSTCSSSHQHRMAVIDVHLTQSDTTASVRDVPTDCHYHDDHHSLSSRFSSGDLSSELEDEAADPGLATVGRDSSQPYQAVPDRPLQSQPGPIPPPSQPPIPGAPPQGPPQPIGGDLSLNLRPGSRTTSAPSSPAKTRESLLQRVQSLTGAARDQASWHPPYIYTLHLSDTFCLTKVSFEM